MIYSKIYHKNKKDDTYFPNNDISDGQIDTILKDSKLIEN